MCSNPHISSKSSLEIWAPLDGQIVETLPANPSRRRNHRETVFDGGSSKPLRLTHGKVPPTPLKTRQMKSIVGLFLLASLQRAAAQTTFDVSNFPSAANSTVAPISAAPTLGPPIPQPTYQPTESHLPSITPRPSFRQSTSYVPTGSPTLPQPTSVPVSKLTQSPTLQLIMPSSQPSHNETLFITRPCSQLLLISQNEEFDDIEVGIYSLQIESYTDAFGLLLGTPFIVADCEVFNQGLAGGRKRRGFFDSLKRLWPWKRNSDTTGTLLLIEFNIKYSTNYGYEEIFTYPSQFQTFMNENLEQVTIDMQTRFLPVIEAKEVIVYNTDAPTVSPAPTIAPVQSTPATMSPIGEGETMVPSGMKTLAPTITASPSIPVIPVVTTKPSRSEIVNDQRSFVVGLAAGLSGAALVVLLFILYTRRTISRRRRDEGINFENSRKSQKGVELVYNDNGNIQVAPDDGLEDGPTHVEAAEPMDVIVSNPSMVSEGGSICSNPNDIQEGVPVETLQDEFDNYKNQDLEFMRNGVEESVYGAEGMMSLAMTRALMEEEDENVDWGGAQDCASMEANIFCEMNDWLRKNENASLERRIAFFQDILNKMVITVRRGMVRPADGTRAIHCCAAMLGIPLEQDIPNNVLLVYGMRKTSDIYQGRSHLIDAFKQFGDIETAGINPKNKGFGFVRFSHPKSVDRAFDRFKVSEIEVQDVSVMMKPLKPEHQTTL